MHKCGCEAFTLLFYVEIVIIERTCSMLKNVLVSFALIATLGACSNATPEKGNATNPTSQTVQDDSAYGTDYEPELETVSISQECEDDSSQSKDGYDDEETTDVCEFQTITVNLADGIATSVEYQKGDAIIFSFFLLTKQIYLLL